MKRPTFDHTISILVKAYLNNTLSPHLCCACAVGNIVRHSYGEFTATLPFADGTCGYGWSSVFCTEADSKQQRVFPGNYIGDAKAQIDSTGYTWRELAKVEHVFETMAIGKTRDERMFNGLMAVCDALSDIHGVDLTLKEEAKKLFVKV